MMNNKIAITISIVSIILLGIAFGYIMYDSNATIVEENMMINNQNILAIEENQEIEDNIKTSVEEEKSTPNTLIVYKTYYTKCKHYIQTYEDIDASLVNLTEKEFKEKNKEWRIDKYSQQEIELSKEVESFCGEHYRLRLKDNAIVIYKIDETGVEREYEKTDITTEYLTTEDILKLTPGIEVYGKENLTSTIEDYE